MYKIEVKIILDMLIVTFTSQVLRCDIASHVIRPIERAQQVI